MVGETLTLAGRFRESTRDHPAKIESHLPVYQDNLGSLYPDAQETDHRARRPPLKCCAGREALLVSGHDAADLGRLQRGPI